MADQPQFYLASHSGQPEALSHEAGLRLLEALEKGSALDSGNSKPPQGEPGVEQNAAVRSARSRRASGSDTEARKVAAPRRLRWHVSYGKSKRKGASPRSSSQDPSSDESYGTEGRKRQRKDWQADKHFTEKADPIVAAKNKASRERQRREKLNDSFVDLSMALDPDRSLKAEKTTVIADTIKMLGHIRSENGQLKHEKEQLKDHIVHMERQNKELHFEHSLLKRELETARQTSFRAQPHPFLGGPIEGSQLGAQVVVGVPVHSNGSSMLMVDQMGGAGESVKSLPRQSNSLPACISKFGHPSVPQPAMFQGQEESFAPGSQAIRSSSPADFFDLDLPMTEAFADLSKDSAELSFLPPVPWMSQGDTIATGDSMTV